MRGNNLQAETVIDINRQDLNKLSNIKLDLHLLEHRKGDRYQKARTEIKPAVKASPKITVRVSSIKARASVQHINGQ